jgi:hypothetical protein
MAISNLVKSGQSFERPSVSAFFGKSTAANDNLQKKSDMFSGDNFVTSITNMLQNLNGQLQKLQETSKQTILAFNKIIKDIRDVKKDIVSKFRIVNRELDSNKLDFVNAIRGGELPKPMMMPEPGTPVPANAPAAPVGGGGGFDLMSALETLLGASLVKDIITWVPRLVTFFTGPVGGALLGGFAAFAAGMFTIASLADKFENWLGLKEKYKARQESDEYKELQKTQSDITNDVRKTNVDKAERIKLIQKTLDDNKIQKKDVDKLQGDILTTIDGRRFDIMTQKPEIQGPQLPSGGAGSPAAAAPTVSPPAPGGADEGEKPKESAAAGGGGTPAASAPAPMPAPAAPSTGTGGAGSIQAPAPAAPSTGTGGAGSIQAPGAGTPAPVTPPAASTSVTPSAPAAGTPTPVEPNTTIKGQEAVYTAMGDLAIPGTPEQKLVGSGRGSVNEDAGARALAQEVGSGRGSVIEKAGARAAANAPKAAVVATPAVDPHAKSKALFQEVLDMEARGDGTGASVKFFEADKQRQAELAALKQPQPGAPAKKAEPKKQKEMSAMDKMRMGRGAGDHTAPMGLGDESAGYTGASGDILQAGLNQQAALNAGPEPGYSGKAGGVLQTNLNDMAVVEAEQQKERAAAAQKMQAIDDADMARAPGEKAKLAQMSEQIAMVEAGASPAAAGMRAGPKAIGAAIRGGPEASAERDAAARMQAIDDADMARASGEKEKLAVMSEQQAKIDAGATPAQAGVRNVKGAGRLIGPKPADLEPPSKNNTGASSEPVVINNNQTQNTGTTSGGAGNNVAGQNLPLSAVNTWLKSFFDRGNKKYQ